MSDIRELRTLEWHTPRELAGRWRFSGFVNMGNFATKAHASDAPFATERAQCAQCDTGFFPRTLHRLSMSKRRNYGPHSIARCGLVTYFVQRIDGGPIKIGITTDIRHRLSSLQGAVPTTLVCIALVRGDREDELHARFHHLRICGEWFEPGPELLEFIRTEATPEDIRCPLPLPHELAERYPFKRYARKS
jgi:hypothetical protein